MKKSDLQEYIRNQIINELSEDQKTQDDIKDTEELIAKTKELEKAKEDAGLAEEVVNEEDIKIFDPESGLIVFTNNVLIFYCLMLITITCSCSTSRSCRCACR